MQTMPTRWKAHNPEIIQLYSLGTPNGKKASIMLEELELPYEAHRIDLSTGEQFDPEFVAMNPNSKIPVIIDPEGPGGPTAIMESGAILYYLGEKTGRLLGDGAAQRLEVLQWTFMQVGSVGPMFGQLVHYFNNDQTSDDYGKNRYGAEVQRLLGVLDRRLEGRNWLADDYSIADIMTAPWLGAIAHVGAEAFVGYNGFGNVLAWVNRFNERPAVQRGLLVCPIG